MQKDIDLSKQILKQMLRQTQMFNITESMSLKKGIQNKQQACHKETDRLIQQLCVINQQLSNNKDKVANYCLAEIQRKQQKNINQINLNSNINIHKLQSINVDSFHSSFGFIAKQKKQQDYVYLKIKNKLIIFNRAFIPNQQLQITFILSQCKFEYIISYVQICIKLNKIVKIVAPAHFWLRISSILKIFFGDYILLLLNSQNVKLFTQQKAISFQFDNSVLIFNKTMWIWDSYNVFITLKSSKLAIYGAGITNDEQIYTAWRKDIITEQQYCKLIDKTFKNNINWSTNQIHNYYEIKDQCSNYINLNLAKLNIFMKCEVFMFFDRNIINQIYQCGQIIQYEKNQIIYKQKTLIDKFYVILQGAVKVDKSQDFSSKYPQYLTQSDFFSNTLFFPEIQTQNVTLRVNSKTVLFFSIPTWKIKFILGSSYDELRQIQNVSLQNNFIHKLGLDVNLSQRILKYIKIDLFKCKRFSNKTTKLIGKQKIKISVQLWKKLCQKDLRILYNTIRNDQNA